MPGTFRSKPEKARDRMRLAVMDYIEKSDAELSREDILHEFRLNRQDRAWLAEIMPNKAGENEPPDQQPKSQNDHLPVIGVLEVIERTGDGELVAQLAERKDGGQLPHVRILLDRATGKEAGQAPGIGDLVLAKIRTVTAHAGHDEIHAARIIKVLKKKAGQVVGLFRMSDNGAYIEPVDKKAMGRTWRVKEDHRGKAQDGDLVTLDVIETKRLGTPYARVTEVIGALHSERAVSTVAIISRSIPYVFKAETLAEAASIREPTTHGRENWQDLPLITIDPYDAKDHDDAVHAAYDDDPSNENGFVVTVAIADVSAFVRPETSLDREARERGNSVYFPDRVVPMLPEALSNGLCSLKTGVRRAAIAVRMIIDQAGHRRRHSFHRIWMVSKAGLSYEQAQAAFDGHTDAVTAPLVDPVLTPLFAAYRALVKARATRGPLDLDLPERKLVLKPNGEVDRVIVPLRLDAHRLIEEMMIEANVAAAETLEARRVPLLYRVHEAPSLEKLNALREFLRTLDINLAKERTVRPSQFNHILARVRGTAQEALVNEVVLRSQAQAAYSPDNVGHFGLARARYAHFTSPIRRYADLIVHRALIRALELGDDGLTNREIKELDDIATHISSAERRAMAAERETVDRLIAFFLADQVGASFWAKIGGVTRAGLFVTLEDTGADGFIPISTLGREFFHVDEAARAIRGERTGTTYRMGDRVEVKLVEAQPVAGALRFEILSDGVPGKPMHGRSRPGMHRPRDKGGVKGSAKRSRANGKAKRF